MAINLAVTCRLYASMKCKGILIWWLRSYITQMPNLIPGQISQLCSWLYKHVKFRFPKEQQQLNFLLKAGTPSRQYLWANVQNVVEQLNLLKHYEARINEYQLRI